jgi:hypothetical protein
MQGEFPVLILGPKVFLQQDIELIYLSFLILCHVIWVPIPPSSGLSWLLQGNGGIFVSSMLKALCCVR